MVRIARNLAATAALIGCTFAAGCATYGVGPRGLYPPEIRTVYVPMFESASFRRNLGERLTEAVIKEIEARTPYKVVPDSRADSILSGRIVGETKRILVESPTDEPRELEVNFEVQVSWIDRSGQMLRTPGTVIMPPELVTIGQSASAVPEVGQSVATAQQQAIDRLARRIVALMEAPW